MNENKGILSSFEPTSDTNITEDNIVAGTDFFLIPKYRGIRLIKEAVNAYTKIFTISLTKAVVDTFHGMLLNKRLYIPAAQTVIISPIIIEIKVNVTTIMIFDIISFFLFTG